MSTNYKFSDDFQNNRLSCRYRFKTITTKATNVSQLKLSNLAVSSLTLPSIRSPLI